MIINGDCLEELDKLDENSIDAIVTDPPYGLTSITKRFGKEGSAPAKYGKDGSFARLSKGFMGQEWDGSGIEHNVEMWQKCLKVLKPGGYLLAFGGSRTYHRIACAIEDAGFEIRDCMMWLYGSGFPKSMNIGLAIDKKNRVDNRTGNIKTDGSATGSIVTTGVGNLKREYEERIAQNEWKGWGTALKPSYEPIIVARKPFNGSLVDNVLEYGVGGINIDECRVGNEERTQFSGRSVSKSTVYNSFNQEKAHYETVEGRFPANTILTYDETDFDTSSWLRYFYCAKASKKDRDEGLDEFEEKTAGQRTNRKEGSAGINAYAGATGRARNIHPTVKPTSLMQYLVRLVAPKGATILDPFMGSGSTGKAVMYENKERNAEYKFIGIEKVEEYCKIAEARMKQIGGEE